MGDGGWQSIAFLFLVYTSNLFILNGPNGVEN